MNITILLGVSAALLHGFAYFLYNRQVKSGDSIPNAASWSVWAFLSILNAASYQGINGDWVASLQFMMGSVACLLTFLYVMFIGKFSKLTKKEWGFLVAGFFAVFIWYTFQNAAYANLIVLGAFLVSAYPTFEGVLKDPNKETPLSWKLWTIAFTLTTINLFIRDGSTIEFVTPVALLVAHGAIAWLCRPARKMRFAQTTQPKPDPLCL